MNGKIEVLSRHTGTSKENKGKFLELKGQYLKEKNSQDASIAEWRCWRKVSVSLKIDGNYPFWRTDRENILKQKDSFRETCGTTSKDRTYVTEILRGREEIAIEKIFEEINHGWALPKFGKRHRFSDSRVSELNRINWKKTMSRYIIIKLL